MKALFLALVLFFATPVQAQQAIKSEQATFKPVTVADGLKWPWGIAFLPEGGYLVTERGGRLLRISADGTKTALTGLPGNIISRRQGGLLDVVLDPDFMNNHTIYFSYSGRGYGGTGTEVRRARIKGTALIDTALIFAAEPKMRSDVHYGSRLLFAPDGTLLITLGERFNMKEAQNTESHLGSIIRINPDGSIPADNPFIDETHYKPEIYSYGHRNVQGIARQPGTDRLWVNEHGPQGGDEINILVKGANYGWPLVTFGIDYDDSIITTKTAAAGITAPVLHWTPSIAPSGMSFYTGDKFPAWEGDMFVSTLAGNHLRRLEIDGDKVTAQEMLLSDMGKRIRDVATGPDGYLYILTDDADGALIRLEPADDGTN